MNDKPKYNPQIHHRRSIRLKGYDYSQAGLYFITICCQDRICRFGKVENGKMVLNDYGEIAFREWIKTPEIRTNVSLGEFIIMPNHVHAIIRLLGRGELHSPEMTNELHSPEMTNELHSPENNGGVCKISQPTENNGGVCKISQPTENNGGVCKTPLRSPSQTVGAIVRGYKSSVSKQLRTLGFNGKLWQHNYYEHIIRDGNSHRRISDYIINNPAKWGNDKFYTE